MHQSWKDSFNCMFPKRSSEFAFFYFMSIFFSLFCDWWILLGRVDNPMRDNVDIIRSEIFRSNGKKQFE